MTRERSKIAARRLPDPDTLSCRRCLEPRPTDELDRMLWCDDCRFAARRRAARWARWVALLAATALALWVGLAIRPSNRFLLFWGAAIIIGYRLVSQLVQELIYGVMRVRNRPGARARRPEPEDE